MSRAARVGLPSIDGERDAHAVERHYGDGAHSDTLGMSRAVERPAVTPGEAAAEAEQARAISDLRGGAGRYAPAGIS